MSALFLAFAAPAAAKDARMSSDEVLQKHIDSIGQKAALDAAKSRQITGQVRLTRPLGGAGTLDGTAQIASDAPKIDLTMTFNAYNYGQDEVAFDGSRVVLGTIRATVRSALADLLNDQQVILREGLLGGTLSSAWPLLDLAGHNAKLSYDGLKKIDSRQLHQVTYTPKKNPDHLAIKLFFEPDTFRHVMTQCTLVRAEGLAKSMDAATGQREMRFVLTERFGDFRVVNGLTLPASYTIEYSSESAQRTGIWVWQFEWQALNKQPLAAAAK